jgi:hypothetical protein
MIIYKTHKNTDWQILEASKLSNAEIIEEVEFRTQITMKPKKWYERRSSFLKRAEQLLRQAQVILQINGASPI